jgi:hypothetical protein
METENRLESGRIVDREPAESFRSLRPISGDGVDDTDKERFDDDRRLTPSLLDVLIGTAFTRPSSEGKGEGRSSCGRGGGGGWVSGIPEARAMAATR